MTPVVQGQFEIGRPHLTGEQEPPFDVEVPQRPTKCSGLAVLEGEVPTGDRRILLDGEVVGPLAEQFESSIEFGALGVINVRIGGTYEIRGGTSHLAGGELAGHEQRIVINSSSSVDAGEAVAASLPGAIYVQADISDPADCTRLIDTTIENFGRLDVLVNNGGAHDIGSTPLTDEVFAHIFDVIVIGTHRLTELAAVHLRAAGDGSVVNVTSLAGLRSAGASIPYAVSKAALNHLTVVLADTYAPAIRVNAVAPGLIRTPWTAGWDELHEQVANSAPLQRSGESIEVARVILDVAAATYVTGQVISVDGGMSIR